MEIINKDGYLTLEAAEGMFLTQKAEVLPEHESRLYVEKITVNAETKDNYRESTLAEKESYENSLLNMPIPASEPEPELMQKSMSMQTPKLERSIESQRVSNAIVVGELKNELQQAIQKVEQQDKKYKKLTTALLVGVGIIILGIVITIVIM